MQHLYNRPFLFRKLFILVCLTFISIVPKNLKAQSGQLDATFNPLDNGFNVTNGANKDVKAIALQADGKIIIGGNFTSFNGTAVNRIARLNTDGTLDAGFNAGGSGVDSTVTEILIQADGKIIVGGFFNSFNEVAAPYLIRLNTDGSKDAGFNTGTGPNGYVNAISMDANGKILAGGKFTGFNGVAANNLVRLNANGSKDAVFTGSALNSVNDIAIQTDGKILVGINNDGTGLITNFLRRLTTLGAADPTFNVGQSGANNSVKALRVLADGKILVGGDFSAFNDFPSNFTRINQDGSLDAGFENTNGLFYGGIKALTVQADGKILVGYGEYKDIYGGITEGSKLARLNADGTADASFHHDFYPELNENVFTVLVQPDGKILVGETFINHWGGSNSRYLIHDAGLVSPGMRDFRINRYNADGSRDQQFGNIASLTGPNRNVLAVVAQPDGKVVIGGSFFSYNGSVSNYIARLNVDGSKDLGFNAGGTGFDKRVNALAIQPDGKIIVAGVFTSYNSTPVHALIRLNTDGSKDASFNYIGSNDGNEYTSLCLQPDGKILVGAMNKMFRVNSDGSPDNTYNTVVSAIYGVFFPYVYSISLQPDGKILVGGYFSRLGGARYLQNIARLNADGSKDESFAPFDPNDDNVFGGANGTVKTITSQPDGKILFGGLFTSFFSGTTNSTQNYISRVSATGVVDASFNAGGTGPDAAVNAIVVQPNGKILIAGNFTSYNSIAVNGLARLNADGTLDTDFNPGGTGSNDVINNINFETSGRKFYISGNFTSYNGTGKNRIVRITACTGSSSSVTDTAVCPGQLPFVWNGNSYATAGTYHVVLTNINGCDSIATLQLSVSASSISGPARACAFIQPSGGTAVYHIVAPAGSTLTWSVSKPATMLILGGQGSNTINVQFTDAFTTGNVSVRVINSACAINVNKSLAVSRAVPSTPGAILASTTNICSGIVSGNSITYHIPKTTGATSYIWSAQAGTTSIYHPNGAGINDTTIQVIFSPGFTNSNISVQAVNDCGTSSTRNLLVRLSIPATPGSIAGPSNVCEYINPASTLAVYSVTNVPDVLYTWTRSTTTAAGSDVYTFPEHTNSISTNFDEHFLSVSISVTASNGCGTSAPRTLTLRKLSVSAPGGITATNTGSCPNRTYTYSIATTPANSTSVLWTVPAGGTILSGQGTNAINVSYSTGAISGYVGVQAFNNCSASAVRKLTVSLSPCPPGIPFSRNENETEIKAADTEMDLKVFPNPSIADFKLQLITLVKEEATVRIFDIQGRLMKEMKTSPNQILNFGSDLTPGTYFVEVRQGITKKTTRIVKL
jgi:uncharacterized delta-60 repeat protein